MRKQYYFRPSSQGYLALDVDRLVELTREFEIKQIRLETIKELDENHWFNDDSEGPTCRNVVEHAKLIQEADLDYPIILSENGRVMDGMHRVCKAILLGHNTVKAVQFEEDPEPDYIDVYPDELPY